MRQRLSLRTILVGGAVLAAAIPAALVGIVLVGSLRDSAIDEATARYELLAQGLASEHEQILGSHRHAAQMLALHLEEARSLGGVAPLLARTRAVYPAFDAVAVIDPTGRVVASDPPETASGDATGIDLSGRPWFPSRCGIVVLSSERTWRSIRSGRAAAVSRSPWRSATDPVACGAWSPRGCD